MDTMTTPIGADWRNQGGAHGRTVEPGGREARLAGASARGRMVEPSGRVNQTRSAGTLRRSLAFTGGLARTRVAGGPGSSLYGRSRVDGRTGRIGVIGSVSFRVTDESIRWLGSIRRANPLESVY